MLETAKPLIFPDINNITDRLYLNAKNTPNKTALIMEDGNSFTFIELIGQIQARRLFLRQQSLQAGDRVLVLVPLSQEFVLLLFALFAENIIPVLIDPRLPKTHWKKSIAESKVKAIFSTQKILRMRWIWWWMQNYRLYATENLSLHSTSTDSAPSVSLIGQPRPTSDQDTIMITLTSGTTGPAKMISRSFGILKNQQKQVSMHLPPLSQDIHLPLYGVSLLHSLVHGSTTVLAKDHSPQNLLSLMAQHNVTRFSSPPSTLSALTSFIQTTADAATFSSSLVLKNILTGSAPIPRWLVRETQECFPQASINIVYGSTECEPISTKKVDYSFFSSSFYGYNVGKIIPNITLLKKYFVTIQGTTLFELLLKGTNCTPNSPDGYLHTGDIGYMNDNEELVLVGRKTDLLKWPFLGLLEEQFETLSGVKRVVIQSQTDHKHLIVFVEISPKNPWMPIKVEMQRMIQQSSLDLTSLKWKFQRLKKVPVDARHGWKIQRHLL